jgi:hypothetical protein
MRPGFFRSMLFAFVAAAPVSHAVAEDKLSATRADSVINAFQVMCTIEPPNFEHIDEKAGAMRMHLQHDSKAPSPGNTVTRSKSWASTLTTGPFALMLDEMSGSKGKSTSCAIAADVGDTDAFRSTAITVMKLPTSFQPEIRNDGSRSYVWNGIYGKGSTLILRDFKPIGKPGVMLKLLAMQPST